MVMMDGSRIIVLDSTEVYIPENERKRILETLQITHASNTVMVQNAKNILAKDEARHFHIL